MANGKADRVSRRTFIAAGIASPASPGIAGEVEAAAPSKEESPSDPQGLLPRRRLGRANLKVSIVSFGGAAMYCRPRGFLPQKEIDACMKTGITPISFNRVFFGGRGTFLNESGFRRTPSGRGKGDVHVSSRLRALFLELKRPPHKKSPPVHGNAPDCDSSEGRIKAVSFALRLPMKLSEQRISGDLECDASG